jgi:plastocyanin
MSSRGCHPGGVFLIFTLFLGLLAVPVRADKEVDVTISSFDPNPVNISAGEYVVWVCNDMNGPYDIESENGTWSGGTISNPGDSVAVQFLSPGSYSYIDYNFNNGGVGTVSVVANVVPTVNIANPTNNAVFTAPASFNFIAVASDTDADGLFEFASFVGTTNVADQFAMPVSPYGVTTAYTPKMTNSTMVTNLPAGTYTLSVQAFDNANTTVSGSVTITVQNPAGIILTPATVLAGKFRFDVAGLTAGKTNVVQASTNLASSANWVSLATNVASGSSASYTNVAGPGRRYFRILQLP